MIKTIEEQKPEGFFAKYKKWIIALISLHLLPSIIILSVVIGGIGYSIMNNDVNFHPYKSYIISGFKEGFGSGTKDHISFKKKPLLTLWRSYGYDTKRLKLKVLKEKDDYLAQFPESERAAKRAEMKLNNIKLPLQKELDKRFTSGLNFYADYVQKRVDRNKYANDKDYEQALQNEAWKIGYDHGYKEGRNGLFYERARDSLR